MTFEGLDNKLLTKIGSFLDLILERFNLEYNELLGMIIEKSKFERIELSQTDIGAILHQINKSGVILSLKEIDKQLYEMSRNPEDPKDLNQIYIFEIVDSQKLQKIKEEVDVNPSEIQKPSNDQTIKYKLNFYSDDGMIEYKTANYSFKSGTKAYELLKYLQIAKNTPLNLEDIKNNCDMGINVEDHRFKENKDIEDTIGYIRKKLKVKKSEFFPIYKKGKAFIWLEK